MSGLIQIVEIEYRRLCDLAGKIPYGECELVALMISRILPGSVIVRGWVKVDSGEFVEQDIDHFWVRFEEKDVDPLSNDWTSIILERLTTSVIEPSQIEQHYRLFLREFPESSENTMFPLRWKLKSEIFDNFDNSDGDLHLPEPLRQIEHSWGYERRGNPFLF